MTDTRRFLLGTALIAAALFPALDALAPRFSPEPHRAGVAFGLLVSLANVVGSFFLMAWGARRGDRAFFGAFVVGMLGRFLTIGAAAWVAYAVPSLGLRVTLITLVAAFFPLTAYEVYCLVRRLDGASLAGRPAGATAGR